MVKHFNFLSRLSRRGVRSNQLFDVVFYQPYASSIYSPEDGDPPGGAETQIGLLAHALAGRDLKVAVLVYSSPNLPTEVDGVHIISRPARTRKSRWRLVGRLIEIWIIWRTMRSVHSTVFVQRTSSPETGLVAIITKLKGARFVWSSASDVDFEYHRIDPVRRNQFLFRLGVRLADGIVVQTERQQRLCQARFSRSAVVAPSLGQPAKHRTAMPTAFLWIGRLVDYKRPMAFLDLARAIPDAYFRMVGVPSVDSPNLADEVRNVARSIDNVELLLPRPRAELMVEIDSAVAIVNTAEHEGMPNIFLEGWARGVPALAFGNDPDGVIARHGLGECAENSTERFVSLASSMWTDRERQFSIAQRCQCYMATQHSPDAIVGRWVQILGVETSTVYK